MKRFKRTRTRSAATACLLAATLAAGCGSSDWGYVEGTVTLEGQPVGPGTLVFEPASSERSLDPSSLGYFDASGNYKLMSAGKQPGAKAGEYRVLIMAGGPSSLADEATAADEKNSPIPTRYQDYDAGLTAKVQAGQQRINFDLKK